MPSLSPRLLFRLLPLIGVSILVYMVAYIGPASIIETLANADAAYLAYAFLLSLVYLMLQNLKWKYLLDRQGIRLGFPYLLKISLIGIFYGFITPGKVGSLMRVKYIKEKSGKSTGACSVSVILDRAVDFVALSFIAMVGMSLIVNYVSAEVVLSIAMLFFLFMGVVYLMLNRRYSRRLLAVFWRFAVPSSLKPNARNAFGSFYDNVLDLRYMLVPFLLSVLAWITMYSATYLVGLSIGAPAPYASYIAIMPLSVMIGLIPVTIGGWGTREAVMIFLFSMFGTTGQEVIVISILMTIVTNMSYAILGALFALTEERR